MAPKGPVAMPKVRGREKIPAPTIDPTTIAVNANRENFAVEFDISKLRGSVTTGVGRMWRARSGCIGLLLDQDVLPCIMIDHRSVIEDRLANMLKLRERVRIV